VLTVHMRENARLHPLEHLRGKTRARSASRSFEPQLLGVLALRVEMSRENAALGVKLAGENGRSGAVTEDDCDVAPASGEIDAGRMDPPPYQEPATRPPRLDELIRDRQAVHEAGALVLDVESGRTLDAEQSRQHAGARREVVVRAERREQHEVHLP